LLAELIRKAGPCVILIDELVAYIRQFEEGKSLPGGTYDANLTFVQALTESLKNAPHAVLLASLPESEREAGSERGIAALRALEHYFSRVQTIWKPVSTEESFEIVRRRLFTEIRDQDTRDTVCRAFADLYLKHPDDLPGEAQEGRYYDRLRSAYPIHPEVFQRLYQDWSALPTFQRTRGVLKLMAKVIHRLWQSNDRDLLIMPGSLPLYDSEVSAELTSNLPVGWDPVLSHDVDGESSEPATLETQEARFGSIQACRRITRSIFLGSAPVSGNEMARGVETERLVLSTLQPGQAPHVFRDALSRLKSKLTFLNEGNNRWWLDVKPNLRREMEDRKRRFKDIEVLEEIETSLRRVLGGGAIAHHHIFTPAADVPDDWDLRLVVLSPNTGWTRGAGPNPARDAAASILKDRGGQPRMKQNRLLFLAADADQVSHLKDTVRALLAWRSIETDLNDTRITLDNIQAKQVEQNKKQTSETVFRLVRDTFKWLVAPTQTLDKKTGTPKETEWESQALNPATVGLGKEIDRALTENQWVIGEWAPVNLHHLLKSFFWKEGVEEVKALDVWQKSCSYLFLPRLAKSTVLQHTIAAGAASRDFFGLASGKEGDRYLGFTLGEATSPFMEVALLIEPGVAAKYEEATRPAPAVPAQGTANTNDDPPSASPGPTNGVNRFVVSPTNTATGLPTHFWASAELAPAGASLKFAKIMSELVELFSARHGTKVVIKVDIEATDSRGFDETTVRAANENKKILGIESMDFD
ncbi:MAG: ATP-binding protein, partial [Proteobacteria bacterium]|nr:ATP-binding protein [Pseudomonadota bacterium]